MLWCCHSISAKTACKTQSQELAVPTKPSVAIGAAWATAEAQTQTSAKEGTVSSNTKHSSKSLKSAIADPQWLPKKQAAPKFNFPRSLKSGDFFDLI